MLNLPRPTPQALLAFALLGIGVVAPELPAQVRPTEIDESAFDSSLFRGMRYRMIGPARGGRVTTVTGISSQPHTFYMGTTGGGVWRTTDAGLSWVNVSDGYFAVGSMGAIRAAETDPNIIYAGTGSDGIRSNVSTGRGVYKSTDGAKTWSFAGLRDVGQIGAVEIHPTNPDIVFVAAIGQAFGPNPERGVYRSRDGAKTWQKVLFVSDSTGASDLEFQPGNPSVLYATMWRGERKPWSITSGAREGGVYKSTDGGDSWKKLTAGLPSGLIGKGDLAVSRANPNRLYALIEALPGGGLYRSDDAGESWTLVSTHPGMLNRPFYYTNVDADPTNADIVYTGAEGFFKSTDGGKTFRTMSTPHGDNHDLWINPKDARIMVQSNDGGANVTLDGGTTWSTQYNQPTAELYQVAVDNQFPYRVYGAQQDNSTLIVPSLPPTAGRPDDWIQQWMQGPGCETGPIVPHSTNPDTVYGACKGQFSRLSLRTGQEKHYWVGAQFLYGHNPKDLKLRFQRVSPIEISPHDPRIIYHASQFVHRTRDEGVSWETISPDLTANEPDKQVVSGQPITRDITGEEFYSTIYAVRESPLVRGVIWAGANDGPVHVTRDGGKTWKKITPRDLPPGGRVQQIEPSPHRAGSAYIAVYRYLLGDWAPYIYRTDDYGASWTRLTSGSNGIPGTTPTRVVREDPDREGLLYAGTEFGLYVSFDNGRGWQPIQLNLPATPITDIRVHRKDLVISTQGRSFWILDNLTPLHQLSQSVASSRAHLFAPRETFRMRYQATASAPGAPAASAPEAPRYPPPGAMIDYYLAEQPAGEVMLEILDGTGKVVRGFSSEASGEGVRAPEQPGMRRPEMERTGAPRIPKTPGMHRIVWDLAHPGSWDANTQRSGRNGPRAVPGTYRVRLSVAGTGSPNATSTGSARSQTRPLVVRIDPRVAKDGVTQANLAEQLALNIRLRDAVSEARMAAARIKTSRERLANAGGAAAGAGARAGTGAGAGVGGAASDTLQKLTALESKLVTAPVRYSQPMLVAQLEYLYGLTTSADQRVGRDAIARFRELRSELDAELAKVRTLLGDERVRATASEGNR